MTDNSEERYQEHQRMVEAVLFASETPLSVEDIALRLPEGADVASHIEALTTEYATKGEIGRAHV